MFHSFSHLAQPTFGQRKQRMREESRKDSANDRRKDWNKSDLELRFKKESRTNVIAENKLFTAARTHHVQQVIGVFLTYNNSFFFIIMIP